MARLVSALILTALLAVAPAWAGYDVGPVTSTDGTAVPDVNKGGAADDQGCWAYTAANVLGAAGWGVGNTAAQKANSVYQDLLGAFKINAGDLYIKAAGDAPAAIKWWVANRGLNAAFAGQGYDPNNQYVNFRRKQQSLLESDYNFLLNELNNEQYVCVDWTKPGLAVGHVMTLVGGNYGLNGPVQPPTMPQDSVWHDSDANGPGGVADQPLGNTNFAPGQDKAWRLNYWPTPGNLNDDWLAEGYLTACPGKPKPASAVDNFDIHYFKGVGVLHQPAGETPYYDVTAQMLTTGNKYGIYQGPLGADPYWASGTANLPTLVVPNQVVPLDHKELYISIDFNDPIVGQVVPNIIVQETDISGNPVAIALDSAEWAADNGQVLLKYVFPDQPAWESIIFPDLTYQTLNGNIYEWNIATECVPEPASLLLLITGVAILRMRRRRT